MKKHLFLLAVLLLKANACFSQKYATQVFDSEIKTLQVNVNNDNLLLPVVEMGGSKPVTISFDRLSHGTHYYSCRLVHCNADWTESSISSSEFVRGFTNSDIRNYTLSQTTIIPYTHYSFSMPNDDMQFTVSGNYALIICEDNNWEKPAATACFSVTESKVDIAASVRGNTDIELNGSVQQLDFDILLKGFKINNVNNDLKIVVRQNNRRDNEITNLKPSYIGLEKLSYINNKKLIFEGGNEFHRFDISSVYNAAHGLEAIRYERPDYHAFITPGIINKSTQYVHDFDVNGKYLINSQESSYDVNTEAEYIYTHFILPKPEPFFDGKIYIGGEWNYNLLDNNALMQYNFNDKYYFKTVLLKQGGYNFQYLFMPKNSETASSRPIDGSFWQTENEYTIYVYYRPFGARYDRLIGFKTE